MGGLFERAGGRRASRAAVLAGLTVVVLVARVAVNSPDVGLSFLYIVPTILAAVWFGVAGGLAMGVVGALLFALGTLFVPQDHVASATLLRLALFCAVGALVGRLVTQQSELRGEVLERERELDELRTLREALTPPAVPDRPDLELASCFVPASEGVAGDFYLVAAGPSDSTVVVVGDVAGKGLEAARRAAFVRTALSTFVPFTDEPVRLLEMANDSLLEKAGASDVFVTAACLAVRPAEGSVTLALAGHPPPRRLDDGMELDGMRAGMPLGVDVDLNATEARFELPPGAGVVLYTDGLSEARAPAADGDGGVREQFGPDGIAAVLAHMPGAAAQSVVRALRTAAEDFSGGELTDDLCIVALRARP